MATVDIDLNTLPIPDWGLICPKCRYPLVGLPLHRCPECGTEFRMSDVVKPWHRLREPRFTGHELPFPDFGLRCRNCQEPLAGARTRQCQNCGTRFDPRALRPSKEWFVVDRVVCGDVPLGVAEALFGTERVPHLRSSAKGVAQIYGVSQVIGVPLLVPREFYFEVLWLIRQATLEMQQTREHPAPEWACPKCGAAVPGNFDVCWRCQQRRQE